MKLRKLAGPIIGFTLGVVVGKDGLFILMPWIIGLILVAIISVLIATYLPKYTDRLFKPTPGIRTFKITTSPIPDIMLPENEKKQT